ncbi:cytochrome C oxidase subunit III [Gottfriedia acidiceleris]|uniref:cytochrome C oxidase subunit III n=1 Tax=Gottfriedia acidiceleris TaxID=371036 RepID=UPI002FFDA1BB
MYNQGQGQMTPFQWQQLQQQQQYQMQQQQMQQQMNQANYNPYYQGASAGYEKKSGCGCGSRTTRR